MTKPVVTYQSAPVQPVVGRSTLLAGVKAHPRGLDGYIVQTSTVLRVDGDEIETLNTIYRKEAA